MNDSIKTAEIHDRLIATRRAHLRQQGVILVSDIRNQISLQMHENGFVVLDLNIPKFTGYDKLIEGIDVISKELQLIDSDFILLPETLDKQLDFLRTNKWIIDGPEIVSRMPDMYERTFKTVIPNTRFKLVVLNGDEQVNAFKSEFTKDPHLLQWTNVTVVCINYC